ncbi:hypothetical protein [Nonomuraea sp. NPDC050786]|uniref:hypothetical protein n=1 Tax=Nonomuraea sp. NPDC050786 TaxID=3154840 RepID=UPI00340B254C
MIGRTIFLVLGTLILLFGGFVGLWGQSAHEAGTPIALVGVGFMLGAIAMALTELRKQQQPPAGALRLRDDRRAE